MLWRLILCLLPLMACNTGGPGFAGRAPVALSEGRSDFLMRRTGALVEVIRVSPEAFPRYDAVAERAGRAVARQTGCTPVWTSGDAAVIRMGLSCDGAPAPPPPRPPLMLDCAALNAPLGDAPPEDLTLECAML